MKSRKLRLSNKNQMGFTAIELLTALLVASLIAGGVATGIFQVVTGNARTSNHMTAVRQVQEAGYWVSHDAQMSENVSMTGPTGFPLTLRWTEWDDSINYEVVYTLNPSGGLNDLFRSYSVDGTVQNTGIIARFIDDSSPSLTSCNVTDGEFIFTVTATAGSGSQLGTETRVYKIIQRPGF